MKPAKRRSAQPAATSRRATLAALEGAPLTIDFGGWRLTVRTAAVAPRAPEAPFWREPGLYARRLARRH